MLSVLVELEVFWSEFFSQAAFLLWNVSCRLEIALLKKGEPAPAVIKAWQVTAMLVKKKALYLHSDSANTYLRTSRKMGEARWDFGGGLFVYLLPCFNFDNEKSNF